MRQMYEFHAPAVHKESLIDDVCVLATDKIQHGKAVLLILKHMWV
jgi:hypothetical protein